MFTNAFTNAPRQLTRRRRATMLGASGTTPRRHPQPAPSEGRRTRSRRAGAAEDAPSHADLGSTRQATGSARWPNEGGQAWPEPRSEEHTSELQSRPHLVCRLLLEKKKDT